MTDEMGWLSELDHWFSVNQSLNWQSFSAPEENKLLSKYVTWGWNNLSMNCVIFKATLVEINCLQHLESVYLDNFVFYCDIKLEIFA